MTVQVHCSYFSSILDSKVDEVFIVTFIIISLISNYYYFFDNY